MQDLQEKRLKQIKKYIFDCVVFVQDTCPDGTTLLNILKYYDGVPKDLPIDVVKPDLFQQVITILELRHRAEKLEFLSDDEIDSLIIGDLFTYMCRKYLDLYLCANNTLINKYLENWEQTKTFIETKLPKLSEMK